MCKKRLLKMVWVIFLILILPSKVLAKVFFPAARKKVVPLIVFLLSILSVFSVSICPAAAAASVSEVTHCRLDIVVDPVASRVSGFMEISTTADRDLIIYPNEARIIELHINGKKTVIPQILDKDEITLHAPGPIRLRYETTIKNSEDNLLSDRDIVLKDGWYPVVDGFCTYEVQAVLPGGFIGFSEGEFSDTAPPTIERLITDEKSINVSSPSNMPLYAELTKAFGDKGSVATFMNQRPDASRKFERGGGRKIFLDPGAKGFELRPGKEFTAKERKKGRMSSASHREDGSPAFRRQHLPREASRLKDDDLASASLLIIGVDNPLLRRLGIEVPPTNAGFFIVVTKNPHNPLKVAAIVSGKSREEIDMAQGQITDYRKYSTLTFD
ncbi:MAG: hypothetical protein ABFD66_07885, partial [Smithella sp.]